MPYPLDERQQVGVTLPTNTPPWSDVTFPPPPPPAMPPAPGPAPMTPAASSGPSGPTPPGLVNLGGSMLNDPKKLLAFILPMISGLAARGSGGMNAAGALMQGMLKGYLTAQEAKWNRMEFEGQQEQAAFEREALLMKMVGEGNTKIAELADDPTQQTIFYRQFSEYLENAPAFRGHQELVRQGLMRPPVDAESRAQTKAAQRLVDKLNKDNPEALKNPDNQIENITDPVLRRVLGAKTAAGNLLALAGNVPTTPEGGRPEPKKKLPSSLEDALIEADAAGNQAEVTRILKLIERKGESGRMPPAEKGYQWVTRGGKVIRVSEGEIQEGDQPFSAREGMRAVTSGDANRIAELDTSLDDLDVLKSQLGTTGAASKVGAMLWNPITELTGWGSDAKQRQAVIDRVKQVIGKALEGGVLRKEDEYKYTKILPMIGDPPDVASAKLRGLTQAITQRRQRTIEALRDAGYDVSKFPETGPGAPAPGILAPGVPDAVSRLKARARAKRGG